MVSKNTHFGVNFVQWMVVNVNIKLNLEDIYTPQIRYSGI